PHEVHGERDDRVAEDLADERDRVVGQVQRVVRGQPEIGHEYGQHRRDRDPDADGQAVAGGSRRDAGGGGCDARHQDSALRPFRAKIPCGRFWMKTMISTRSRILAMTAPAMPSSSLLKTPSPRPAYTAPAIWPTPPSTTTMNESTM